MSSEGVSTSSIPLEVENEEDISSDAVQYPAPKEFLQELRTLVEDIRKGENEPLKVSGSIHKLRQYYYDKKTRHYRKEIGDVLAECGYASCTYKMLKALSMRGFYPEGLEKVKSPFLWRTTRHVLDNAWNYSDDSEEYACDLARANVLEITCDILRKFPKNPEKSSCQYGLLKAALCIMHNISIRPQNKHFFQKYKASKIVFEFKFSNDNFLKVLALTTLACIIDAQEAQKVTQDGDTIHTIIHWMNISIEKDRLHRIKEGFTASDLAYTLEKLAIDGNAEKIIEGKALKSFYRMLCTSDVDQQINAAKCIWTLSFNPEARKQIIQFKDLVNTLHRLEKEEDNKELLKHIKGALWVLFEKADTVKHQTDQNDPKHLFISYCWNEKETVRKIWQKLIAAGYKVWIDIERMSGDILEAMASAVEQSSVVIMCVSEGYKQSQCCRTEATYSYKQKRDFIPLYMQAPYNPDGWLGALLSTKLYFNFSSINDVDFDDSFRNLLKELNNKGVTLSGSDSKASSEGPVTLPPVAPPRRTLSGSSSNLSISSSQTDTDDLSLRDNPVGSRLNRSPNLQIRKPRTPIQAQPSPTTVLTPASSTSTVARSPSLLTSTFFGGPPDSYARMKKVDVREWLKENDMEQDIPKFKKIDGRLLWQLKCMKAEAPQFFYQMLQGELQLSAISILKFRQALEDLD